MAFPFAAAAITAASIGAGASSAHGASKLNKSSRRKAFDLLKRGRTLYGLRADQAIAALMQNVGLQEEATRAALADISGAENLGVIDTERMMAQRLAASRTGAQGVLAQSSVLPQQQRGIYQDAMAELLRQRSGSAGQRAQIRTGGAARSGSALGLLSSTLMQRAGAEYDIEKDFSSVYTGQMSTGGSFDFSGLYGLMSQMFPGTSATPPAPVPSYQTTYNGGGLQS